LQSPGLGLPGAVAGVAAVLLLGAPFLVGLSEWWHIALFLVGFALLLVELFVTPGFGLIGVAGIVCMFVGLALQVIPSSGGFSLPPPEMFGRLQQTVLWMLAGALLSMVGAYFVAKSFGRIPLLNRLVLTQTQYAMTGEGAGALNPIVEPVSGSDAVGHGLIGVGDQGRVVSQLRPTGRAEFQGQIVDVISAVGWIDSNRPVKVVEVHGNRIVVEAAEG
jgi:membrane-bound serine protease (ClpP class)